MIAGTNQNQTFNIKKKTKKKRNFVWRSTHIYKRVFVKNERGNDT